MIKLLRFKDIENNDIIVDAAKITFILIKSPLSIQPQQKSIVAASGQAVIVSETIAEEVGNEWSKYVNMMNN